MVTKPPYIAQDAWNGMSLAVQQAIADNAITVAGLTPETAIAPELCAPSRTALAPASGRYWNFPTDGPCTNPYPPVGLEDPSDEGPQKRRESVLAQYMHINIHSLASQEAITSFAWPWAKLCTIPWATATCEF